MTYENTDLGLVQLLAGKMEGSSLSLIEKALSQTEIFHYLFAAKLIRKVTLGEEFNLQGLEDIDKKLDEIINSIKP